MPWWLRALTLPLLFGGGGHPTAAAAPLPPLVAANVTAAPIYHSSQTPGYTAWCALWRMPSGEIMTNFIEAKGAYPGNASFTFPVLTTTNGSAWSAPKRPVVGFSRGIAVMPDGTTMVRPALTFGSDSVSFGPAGCETQVNKDGSVGYCHTQYSHGRFNGVETSYDGGRTWGGTTYLASQQEVDMVSPDRPRQLCLPPLKHLGLRVQCMVTRIKPLRDGRLVAVLGLRKRGESGDVLHHMAVGTFLGANSTRALSWSKPILLVPREVGTCEESDFVELPNGTLFFMHRAVSCPKSGPNCAQGENHVQSLVLRNADGTFSPQPPTTTFPNFEFP